MFSHIQSPSHVCKRSRGRPGIVSSDIFVTFLTVYYKKVSLLLRMHQKQP